MLSGIAASGQAAAVTSMRSVFLKEGRERPVLRGHPWIFSGAIERVAEDSDEAGLADVFDAAGRWLARGLFSPKSQIRVRVLTASDEAIDRAFFAGRLARASAWRKALLAPATDAYRLINGEGDFLPGLVVDRYGDFLVCQFVSAAMDGLKGLVVDALAELFGARGIYERSEGGARAEEGLEPSVGLLAGEEPPAALRIEEHGLGFLVDIREGQKTGFFLDQRDHRLLLRELAHDRSVLNCFAYTGAFALSALKGGAREVVSVESSRAALDLARSSAELNGLSAPAENFIKGDVFSYLKQRSRQFDLVVLDPPSLAHRRGDVAAASGSYKFLNLHALRVLKDGGLLMTFCCSQHLSVDLFQKIVFGAAVDSRRIVQVLKRLGHPVDHPVSLHHPEGEYLKGLLLRVVD